MIHTSHLSHFNYQAGRGITIYIEVYLKMIEHIVDYHSTPFLSFLMFSLTSSLQSGHYTLLESQSRMHFEW